MRAILIGTTAIAAAAWLGLSLYTQPREHTLREASVTQFLELALAGDSAGLAARAASPQPVQWALAAAREDPIALREWTAHGGRIGLVRTGDTVLVSLRRNRSTPRCSFLSSLVATLLIAPGEDAADAQIIALSASCPDMALGQES